MRAYLSGWQGRRPSAVFTPDYFRRDLSTPLRIHRRTWLGVDRPARNIALLPQRAWLTARWRRSPTETWQLPSQESMQRLAELSGVSVEVQLQRLGQLRLDPGIPPTEAHSLGLSRDGEAADWPYFLFSLERDWNVAASAEVLGDTKAAVSAIRLLADKEATSELLKSIGIPVVTSRPARDEAELNSQLEAALATWGEAFVKPRYGSAGRGAAVATHGKSGVTLRRYRRENDSDMTALSELAANAPLLVQPKLVTPGWEGLDVVTIRIVTRDRGRGPEVFSEVIEVPRAPHYDHLRVDGGRIGGLVRALWMDDATDKSPPALSALEPIPLWIAEAAIAAHARLPGLYAVAWDVAMAEDGPQFLEGNTGFDTLVPQLAAAKGLLSGLSVP